MNRNAENQVKEISEWLTHQVPDLGAVGVVIGVDGTIGSSVTAALAREAFKEDVLGLIMPCRNPPEEVENGMSLVNHFNLRHEIVDLAPVYERLRLPLPNVSMEFDCAMIPRLRMITLYHYGSALNYVVLGTINRSDWEVGFFTQHGDMGADLFPVLHLLRSDLIEIARYLGLPEHIIKNGLATRPLYAQCSMSQSGFTYEELDAYLSGTFAQATESIQHITRSIERAAIHKKRAWPGFSALIGPPEKEPSLPDDHEAYDKSIEALTLISRAITSDQYLEDILRLIVMVTAEVMNSSVCSLWLLDEKEGVLRLRATQSIDKEYLKDRVLKVGEGVVGKVVAENRPYAVPNVLLDPFFKEKELARRMGLVSMLSMPMRVKDRVIGVINCYTSHPHAFSDLQTNLLTAVANQAAVAIEKTELMVQTKVIQEELERRKIIERAKDLLMKRLALSGEEAYRWLQKRSMNTRKSMREVSEAVLLAMEG